jgi:uncharacterized protein YuzE
MPGSDYIHGGLVMIFSYDSRYNIAYIRFQPKTSEIESIKVSDELTVDLAPDGTVYGIELLNANEQLRRGGMGKFLVVNDATGQQVDIPLP